jgi:hypothetical protein
MNVCAYVHVLLETMNIAIDPDVLAVTEFLQARIPARRLVGVAEAVATLAPILWGQHAPEPVQALRLNAEPIAAVVRTPKASNESGPAGDCAGDGSAEGVDSLH